MIAQINGKVNIFLKKSEKIEKEGKQVLSYRYGDVIIILWKDVICVRADVTPTGKQTAVFAERTVKSG